MRSPRAPSTTEGSAGACVAPRARPTTAPLHSARTVVRNGARRGCGTLGGCFADITELGEPEGVYPQPPVTRKAAANPRVFP